MAEQIRVSSQPACGPDCWLRHVHDFELPGCHNKPEAEGPPQTQSSMRETARKLYQPIKRWQTRILNIKAGRFDEPLVCELLTASIVAKEGVGVEAWNEVVEYDALSYSWGRPAFTLHVNCNGLDVGITRHLESALRHIRRPDKDRRLWTDAFCVNQYDDDEKAQQVQNMFLIYRKAASVVVWLGDILATDSLILVTACQAQIGEIRGRSHTQQCFDNHASLTMSAESLLRRAWFHRTWVRQECFAATAITIQCGSITLSWSNLVDTLTVLRSVKSIAPNDLGPHSLYLCFDVLVDSRSSRRTSEKGIRRLKVRGDLVAEAWMNILLGGTAFQVDLGQDRVYGVLGMIDMAIQNADTDSDASPSRLASTEQLPVDYRRSPAVVYQDVVKHIINLSRKLNVLLVFQSHRMQNTLSPSWSLALDHDDKRWFCRPGGISKDDEQFDDDILPSLQDLNERDVLNLTGIIIGKIKIVQDLPQEAYFVEGTSSLIPWTQGRNLDDRRPSLHQMFADVGYKCAWFSLDVSDGSASTRANRKWPNWKDSCVFVSDAVVEGDEIVMCDGSEYPFILRHVSNHNDKSRENCFIFRGPAVLVAFDGLKYGKIVPRSSIRRLYQSTPREKFHLVYAVDTVSASSAAGYQGKTT